MISCFIYLNHLKEVKLITKSTVFKYYVWTNTQAQLHTVHSPDTGTIIKCSKSCLFLLLCIQNQSSCHVIISYALCLGNSAQSMNTCWPLSFCILTHAHTCPPPSWGLIYSHHAQSVVRRPVSVDRTLSWTQGTHRVSRMSHAEAWRYVFINKWYKVQPESRCPVICRTWWYCWVPLVWWHPFVHTRSRCDVTAIGTGNLTNVSPHTLTTKQHSFSQSYFVKHITNNCQIKLKTQLQE